MGCEFTRKKGDGVRVHHKEKSAGVTLHHKTKSDGVRVHHEKERCVESSP